jgi:hypothetical protein
MKKFLYIVVFLILVICGYLAYISIFNSESVAEVPNKKVWTAIGFEPGFILEIEGKESNDKYATMTYPTKLIFQNDGQVDGVLQSVNNNEFTGSLLVGGDAAVPVNIKFLSEKCIKASGESSDYAVKIDFAETVYKGCALKFK